MFALNSFENFRALLHVAEENKSKRGDDCPGSASDSPRHAESFVPGTVVGRADLGIPVGGTRENTFWTVFRYLFEHFLITRLHLSLFFCASLGNSRKAKARFWY